MPGEQQVKQVVIGRISRMANINPSLIQDTWVLKDPPIKMDAAGSANLTLELREYLNSFGTGAVIRVTEVRKNGLTVEGLVKMVYNKLNP